MSDRTVKWSCAAAIEDGHDDNDDTTKTIGIPARRMRLTILHALFVLVVTAANAGAQSAPLPPDDPFAAHRWHFEFDGSAAFEAWNYNGSHEELYGLGESLSYGLIDGLTLRMGQRFIYVSQRSEDAVVLGLTIGLRRRFHQRGRLSAFLQGDLGITYTAIAAPPRGTRFNYLATGGGGVMVKTGGRAHVVTTVYVMHLSNASVKGPGRNPDIESLGGSLGLLLRF